MTKAQEEKIILDLIKSFKTYGLGDIKYNKNRPIAAFILSICFIDQLASFCYPLTMGQKGRTEKFIREYLPIYAGKKVYDIFRNAAIHHYSGKNKYALTNDKDFKEPHEEIKGKIVIHTGILRTQIQKAYKKFEKQLLTIDSSQRKNALLRARKHPPFKHNVI